jgi:hypothetical protein
MAARGEGVDGDCRIRRRADRATVGSGSDVVVVA